MVDPKTSERNRQKLVPRDSGGEAEATAVRERRQTHTDAPPESDGSSSAARRPPEWDDSSDSAIVRQNQRVGDKVVRAQRLLKSLAANHRQRRVLRAAIVRRDEVLLDVLLAELS